MFLKKMGKRIRLFCDLLLRGDIGTFNGSRAGFDNANFGLKSMEDPDRGEVNDAPYEHHI